MKAALALAVVLVTLLAGCGGDDAPPPDPYELAGCIGHSDTATATAAKSELDYIAAEARGGGVEAEINGNDTTIAIATSQSEAESIEGQYEPWAQPGTVIERDGLVVKLWEYEPSDEDAAVVDSCVAES